MNWTKRVSEENNMDRWKSYPTAAVIGAIPERSSLTDAMVEFEMLRGAEDELAALVVADCRVESISHNML